MGVRMTVHGHQHDNIDSSARWAEQGFAWVKKTQRFSRPDLTSSSIPATT